MALNERDLIAIINAHRRDSLGVDDGDLSSERADALDHYHGRPYGDEQEGRSQVVSKDLSETVDWAMPAIMRVFTQSGNLGEFEPVGPEDEELARQESDYINQVVMKDNSGFMLLHDAIKDALLLKNGYVKHYWDVTEKISEEEYQGLTLDELTVLLSQLEMDGAEVEINGQEERQIDMGGMLVPVFDVKLKITRKTGKVCIEAVPCEEVRVSKRCRGSLQTSPFTEHVTRKTRTDLIEMGMDKEFVYSLPAHNESDNDQEVIARDSVDDESEFLGTSINDKSMDEIEFCEAYIKVDWDDDGIAELRKVVTVADKIPPGDYWNEPIDAVPMTGFVPKRVPHRHVGESLDDDLADLQKIKTVLLRQMLDNIYLTNNNQWVVNERVNLKDFMVSLPGGVKRVQGMEPVSGSVEPVITAPVIDKILPVIDYVDNLKESRTGINRATTGLDPDILKQSTKGAFMENLNRASQKIEMITRMLAETGVKELVLQVHALLIKHQDKSRTVKLRGKYVPVNPQEWRERTDLTVKVGLGTGSEEEKREKLMLLASLQEKAAQAGLVGAQQVYSMFADIAETLGFDMPEKYLMSPDSPEFEQQQQGQEQANPLAEQEAVKGQFMLQREEMQLNFKMMVEQMRQQSEHQMKLMEMRMDQMEKEAERRSREAMEAARLEIQSMLGARQVDLGQPGIGAGLQEG
jgi:rubrerythrin